MFLYIHFFFFLSNWRYYVIKFVGDFRQIGGFLRVHQFPLPIKLTATIKLKCCWKLR